MGAREAIGRLFGTRSETSVKEPKTVETNPGAVATAFVNAVADRDLQKAFALVASDAEVHIPPAGVAGTVDDARNFFQSTVTAFPDLTLQVKRSVVGDDGTVAIELKMEGTQAADYLGVVNQEKHLDVDQAWLLRVQGGAITTIHGIWCQNQLYRRLAVKRIDQPAIV